jgi:hypothetical protein
VPVADQLVHHHVLANAIAVPERNGLTDTHRHQAGIRPDAAVAWFMRTGGRRPADQIRGEI